MRVILGAAFVAAFLLPDSSTAAGLCDRREVIIEQLFDRYQEQPTAVGVVGERGLLEVLIAPDGETWSIIISTPAGRSCLVASGRWWRAKDRGVPEEDS